MSDLSKDIVHASDTTSDKTDKTIAVHGVTSSEQTSLLPPTTPSAPPTRPILSSRPRNFSYGAISTPDQPSHLGRATSAANLHQLGAHTVAAARANDTARTTSVSGSKRHQTHDWITAINVSSSDGSVTNLENDLETSLDCYPVLNADIDGSASSSSSSSCSDSDFISVANMPPQTAFLTSSQRRLVIAYCGLLLVAFTTSLEAQVTAPLAAFAVSSFENHSLLSTVVVVQGVVNAVIKPPMAKLADVFGRFEAFLGAVLLCVAGYVQMACSHNVQTFAAAQIMYSAGITGLQVLNQIFVADTTDLRHRALLSSLPDTPFLITVWVGPSIASAIINATSWRWGYAMWAILLPIAFLPLGGSLAVSAYQSRNHRYRQRRRSSCLGGPRPKSSSSESSGGGIGGDAGGEDPGGLPVLSRTSSRHTPGGSGSRSRLARKSSRASIKGSKAYSTFRQLLVDLDIVGILVLSASLSLVLLPLTLAEKATGGWSNPAIVSSIVVGLLLLIFVFPAWEARPDWAPHPLIPPTLLRSVTFCAGCGVAFFFFAVFYLSVQPYFYSYLLVAHNQSVAAAGRITQIFSFTSTIAAVSASVAIRHLRHYKVFVVTGACVYLTGISLMLVYRTADAGTFRLVATQVAVGAGAGLMSVPTQIGIQASVSSTPRLVAAATAVYLTMGEAGIAVGAAISGALWARLVPAKLELYLPEPARQNASAIYSSVVVATSYPWGSPERMAITRAYQESMTSLLTVAVAFCVPVLILALMMTDLRFDTIPTSPATYSYDDHAVVDSDDDDNNTYDAEGLLSRRSLHDNHADRAEASSSSSNTAANPYGVDTAAGERATLLSDADEI
ncbi:hypothetical protein HMPREF1624_00312 [Sporothrix schenckii ATCC 58251]|uniref:Major facilitator superfamily (MFS) profile domain-containing protein n=1 Tax=Sporothrix schenckii (strain ATCC 58251 / de Perez 2211183) TaxID=1391915 RepID=U7Q4C9_SPOS1|nr:hypothetical protein HMPREF1624_00312 [Sporothrix schenckii ATCC 58251]